MSVTDVGFFIVVVTILGCGTFGLWLLRHYPARDEAIAAAVTDAPDLCDPWCPGCENPIHKRAPDGPSVWDALDRHLADQPDEINPLMREIYAALSLARDGVDVEKGAPREWVP